MPDLGKTQEEWTRLLGRELGGLILSLYSELDELERKCTLERTRVATALARPQIAAITLTGVDYGVNTSPEGWLYVHVKANNAVWDVELYRAPGGDPGDLVAHVTGIAAEGTDTLVADNDSGLGGSITLSDTVSADTTDGLRLYVVVDYPARLPKVLTQDGTVEDDQYSRRDLANLYSAVAATMRTLKATVLRTALEQWALRSQDNPVARGNAFTGTSYTTLASEEVAEDGDGNVTHRRTGWLPYLGDCMRDETTGGEQGVVARVLSAGAGVFDAGNDGKGSVAAHTPLESAVPGVHVFEVVDDTLGEERFSHQFTSEDGRIVEATDAGPVVGRLWSGRRGFGPITVKPTLTKTGDDSNTVFVAASGAVVTGHNALNTDDGNLYAKVEANGGNWDVGFYKSSTRHASTLVAKAANVATGAAFEATSQNASGLTVVWQLGNTVAPTSSIVLHLNPFKRENSNGRPDRFTVTVSLTSAGLYQTILAEWLGAFLNSDSAGSETIPDAWVKQGTTIPLME